MTIEPNPIRVKPLLPTSNGAEPVSYMLELIKQGYGPADIAIYGTDGNMGNATGEEFEAGG